MRMSTHLTSGPERGTSARLVSMVALATVLCATACLPPRAQAAPAVPPVADFFRGERLRSPLLSPNGDLLAVAIANDAGRLQLAVIDLRSPDKSRPIAAFDDIDVGSYQWVNDRRLVYTARATDASYSPQPAGGLYAVNADGSDFRQLIERQSEMPTSWHTPTTKRLKANHALQSVLRDGSADVLVVGYDWSGSRFPHTTLLRVNTETGGWRSLSDGAPSGAQVWVTDANGVPRAVFAVSEGRGRLHRQGPGPGEWSLVSEDANVFVSRSFVPLGADSDHTMYVAAARHDEADTSALYRYDLQAGRLDPRPVVVVDGFDFEGGLVFGPSGARLMGVHFESDGPGTVWLDPAMKTLQERIDALLPSTNNEISCRRCGADGLVVVDASSDRQPSTYLLFDVKSGTMRSLGASRPWIQPQSMGAREFVRIRARDGLSLPAYVTRPPTGKGPWPAVVLVHGGPNVRGGHWAWEGQTQFLASRGYLVVEPEFRGSLGYGAKLYKAGFRQWGLAMQDDVADAALWAVEQGLADRSRIAIAGASYGGYATLMGLVRNPEIFRCGVEWVGVTDIDLMYSIGWSDLSDVYKSRGMPELIGDRERDAAQLRATSPLHQAARVTQPLLMAYGAQDRRVPIDHGLAFRDEVRKTNRQVEWVEYPEEGHGFRLLRNQVDFWTRVEKFLAINLRPEGASP